MRSPPDVATAAAAEIVFVVDVSSFTRAGFTGTSTYEGKRVDIEFDDGGAGVFLSPEMAGRLRVKEGSALSVVIEDDKTEVAQVTVGGVGKRLKFSDPRVYFAIGKEGGAVLRVRRG
jgi:hypothetical protein